MGKLTDYPRPSVTVDLIIFTIAENDLKVLLIRRKLEPYKGRWALPGGFIEMDESLEEAAMDLGGRPVAVFFDITVPMLLPALISGWLLAFTLSLDDLVISSFVSGPGATTLPMLIFAKVRLGVTPDINAIATIIILLVAIGVVTAALVSRRRDGAVAR